MCESQMRAYSMPSESRSSGLKQQPNKNNFTMNVFKLKCLLLMNHLYVLKNAAINSIFFSQILIVQRC